MKKGYRSGENRKCCVCGTETYFHPSQIKRGYGQYCSRVCKWKAEGIEKKKCLICGKEIRQTQGCKGGKYCSYECFGKSIQNRVSRVCAFCGKTFEAAPSKLMRKGRGIFCSKICFDGFQRAGHKDWICKYCGKMIHRRGRRKYDYCSYVCSHASQQRRIGLNGLEKKGKVILENIGISFQEQVLIRRKFVVDVLLPNDVVIQWDGDYWHGNPKRYRILNKIQESKRKFDKACNAYLKKCGYNVIRFWEWDVSNKPEWVESEIRKIIGG